MRNRKDSKFPLSSTILLTPMVARKKRNLIFKSNLSNGLFRKRNFPYEGH